MPADFPRIDWLDFAFGVKAVERAGGKELWQDLVGIFRARGLGFA
jgi:hypothetical protein